MNIKTAFLKRFGQYISGCLYIHEKLQRNPSVGRGLKIFIFDFMDLNIWDFWKMPTGVWWGQKLNGSSIGTWTTKSPIRGNHWVPFGCSALLSSVISWIELRWENNKFLFVFYSGSRGYVERKGAYIQEDHKGYKPGKHQSKKAWFNDWHTPPLYGHRNQWKSLEDTYF